MDAVGPLISGIEAAANGYAGIYKRGSTQRAQWFQDFEGTQSVSTGADIPLDSFGSAEVYVDQLVDVKVLDSTGAHIRTFTWGHSSPLVEVRSQSFTGQSYPDGAGQTVSGPSQPTTLQEVLDLWKTQSGSIDWKVLLPNGSSITIQDAMAYLVGVFYNVQSNEFGAKGDGAEDDTTAIQGAIDAASAAGGGVVWFPAGEYRITDPLDLKAGVSLWGAGPRATEIRIDDGADSVLTDATGGELGIEVRGLAFGTDQITSAPIVSIDDDGIHFIECWFQGNSSGGLLDTSGRRNRFTRCRFIPTNTLATPIAQSGATGDSCFHDCTIEPPVGFAGGSLANVEETQWSMCRFLVDALTAAPTFSAIRTTGNCTITGCYFPNPGTGTMTAIETALASDEIMVESGNFFGSAVVPYDYSDAGDESLVLLHSRDNNPIVLVNATTGPISMDTDKFESILIQQTALVGGTLTLDASSEVPLGHKLYLSVWNDSGSNLTVGLGTNLNGTAGGAITTGNMRNYLFLARVGSSGSVEWHQVGTPQDNAA